MSRRYSGTKTVRYLLQRYRRATIGEAVEAAAAIERERLLPGAEEFCKIPVDVMGIARGRGIRLGKTLTESDNRDAVILARQDGFLVRMGANKTVTRNRLSIAHEIGHTLFRTGPRHAIAALGKAETEAEEYICRAFAAALLMPAHHVQRFVSGITIRTPWEVLMALEKAARSFGVSLEALLFRVEMLRVPCRSSMVLLCLKFGRNRFTCCDPRLRVVCCVPLGGMNNVRTWRNRSARGINLLLAEKLFVFWRNGLVSGSEATGGRYTLGSGEGGIVRATQESLTWAEESLHFSLLSEGKWCKQHLPMLVTNCLYAGPRWQEDKAYIISVVRRPDGGDPLHAGM